MSKLAVILGFGLVASISAYGSFLDISRADPRPKTVPAVCGNPCRLGDSPGGYNYQFREAARAMIERHQQLQINGMCNSACTLLAVEMRDHGLVCITPDAFFGFHKTATFFGLIHYDPEYPADIRSWIDAHGGLRKGDDMNFMYSLDARRYFPLCAA